MSFSRISLVALIALVPMVIVIAVHQSHVSSMTASISDTATDETFVTPLAIHWSGQITRIFVSGGGLELTSPIAPGGVFQAYMPQQDQISPITSGSVDIYGLWRGYTCAYGGHDGNCVPDVEIQSIQQK